MRRLYGDRNRELAIQQALMARIEARYERPIRSEIYTRMRKAGEMFENYGDMGLEMALSGHSQVIEGYLTALWTTAMERFAERVEIGKSRKAGIIEGAIRFWFGNYAYEKIKDIAGTTLTQLRDIIRIGSNDGLSQAQIGTRIRDVAPQLAAYRSNVIARTETHGAAQYGSVSGAREVDDTLKKEWISAGDDRTREDHFDVDGQIVAMNEPFEVGGEQLDYPGDGSLGASAGNIINCRCGIGYLRP